MDRREWTVESGQLESRESRVDSGGGCDRRKWRMESGIMDSVESRVQRVESGQGGVGEWVVRECGVGEWTEWRVESRTM